jgi:hypothetical protein
MRKFTVRRIVAACLLLLASQIAMAAGWIALARTTEPAQRS